MLKKNNFQKFDKRKTVSETPKKDDFKKILTQKNIAKTSPKDEFPKYSKRENIDKISKTDETQKFEKRKKITEEPKKNLSKKNVSPTKDTDEEGIRINRYIAAAGICSRREADEQIKSGYVTLNGKVVTELGIRVMPNDVVKFNQQVLKDQKKVYIVMNKSKDIITSAKDESGRLTVLDLLKGKVKARVYPVGRLDKNTTGVLLLTNDGDLTKLLTHPKYNKKKIYHVVLDKNLISSDLSQLADGVELEDGPMFFDTISYVNPEAKNEVGVEIHSGKNLVVRRMFEKLGYEVIKLDRVYFAGLTKKNLKRGQWRYLTEKEVSTLKMGSYQ